MSTNPQTWVAVLATVGIFSFLVKENPFYRFFEFTVIGMAAAHSVVMTWDNFTKPFLFDYVPKGEWYLLIPGVIGLLYYCRYMSPKVQWIYRYPLALMIGYDIGYALAYEPRPFLVQMRSTFENFGSVNSWIFLVVFVAVVVYFIFTLGNKNVGANKVRGFAKYAMMAYFGVAFGNTIQGRFSLLLGRLLFLLQDWLGVVKIGSGL